MSLFIKFTMQALTGVNKQQKFNKILNDKQLNFISSAVANVQ